MKGFLSILLVFLVGAFVSVDLKIIDKTEASTYFVIDNDITDVGVILDVGTVENDYSYFNLPQDQGTAFVSLETATMNDQIVDVYQLPQCHPQTRH
jgi:hypothetical protein